MPAKSEKQAIAARMAYAAKRGHLSPSALKGTALEMYKSMTLSQLRDFMYVGGRHGRKRKARAKRNRS